MQLLKPKHTEQGLTLVEVLVGLLVIAMTSAVIAPPIVLSAATRVQNQRVEQAMQLAQQQVDQVRLAMERADQTQAALIAQLPPATASTNPRIVPVPTQLNCPGGRPLNSTTWCSVDTNSDGTSDLGIQVFRTRGITNPETPIPPATGTPVAFWMGVRVYAQEGLNQAGSLVRGANAVKTNLRCAPEPRTSCSALLSHCQE